jgi:hypothetical protein
VKILALQVLTHRQDGVAPNTVRLGGLAKIQTLAFRTTSASISSAAVNSSSYTLWMGDDFVGNYTYGATAGAWERDLAQLLNIDRVTVERVGDGNSEFWSYGYIYEIAFWGSYGVAEIPSLRVHWYTPTAIEVDSNILQEAQFNPDYSARYIALDQNTNYTVAMRAFNSKGVSDLSEEVVVQTYQFGGLPGRPQSVVLGQYSSNTTLSLSFLPPIEDGGLPITAYAIELDQTSNFDPTSPFYQRIELANVPEVQVIESSYRSGDNVKLRGGTFRVTIGGRTSVPLSYNISAFDLETVMNTLLDTRNIAIAPVTVTREPWIRGFRWSISFIGYPGNVGMILLDSYMMVGDDAQMRVYEKVQGFADIYPGQFTYEVQTVTVSALSAVTGTFVLEFEGYNTPTMSFDEDEVTFCEKLEYIPTIYTAKVTRTTISTPLGLCLHST